MLDWRRPLGRFGFLMGLAPVNTLLGIVAMIALVFHPKGAGHIAVLIIFGALCFVWGALHGRRLADAGRGASSAVGFSLVAFLSFALSHLTVAALWSSPEVQREAFRTGGGLGGGTGNAMPQLHIETLPLLADAGQALAATLGAAGALALSGLVVGLLLLLSLVCLVFSGYCLLLGRGQPASVLRVLPAFKQR